MRRLLTGILTAGLLAAGCRERPPPATTYADLDASPPDRRWASPAPRAAVATRDAGGRDGGGAAGDACRATLLVVFDRSGSMDEPWAADDLKWQAASRALAGALAPYLGRLRVGGLLFPSGPRPGDGSCAPVAPIDRQIPVGPGESFPDRFREALDGVGGSTPLDAAFARAAEAIAAGSVDGVLVVTDGQPTCVGPVSASTYAERWAALGIPTWVIGLPGVDDPGVLDAVAVAGGTRGSVPVDDPVALGDELSRIVGERYSQICP